jgi:hypothetical protein
MRVRTPIDGIVSRLAAVLSRRLAGSIFLEGSREDIFGLPGTMEDLLRGLVGDMEETYLPAKMQKAKGYGTGDQPVVDLLIIVESVVQDFSRFFPALSAFLVSVHHDEILSRIKREGSPEKLWTPKMTMLAERLNSVSKQWSAIANRKVRGKTAETKWLLEISRVLADVNCVCVEILTAIIEAEIEGER